MDNPWGSPSWQALSQAKHREGITLCQHLFDVVSEWRRKPLMMVLFLHFCACDRTLNGTLQVFLKSIAISTKIPATEQEMFTVGRDFTVCVRGAFHAPACRLHQTCTWLILVTLCPIVPLTEDPIRGAKSSQK